MVSRSSRVPCAALLLIALLASGCTARTDPGERTSGRITIESDRAYTNRLEVVLTLDAPEATRYVLAASADECARTTAWEPMNATRDYVLPLPNSENTVYARFANDAGPPSDCVSDAIVHDDLAPLPPVDLLASRGGSSSRSPTLTFSTTDRGPAGIEGFEGRVVDADTGAQVEPWVEVSSGEALTGLTALESGRFYCAEVRAVDRAGNSSAPVRSPAWSDDVTERVLLSTFPTYFELRFGDLDGDGDLDVVVFSTHNPEVAWYENLDGQATLATPMPLLPDAVVAVDLELADVDGDGDPDFVVVDNAANEVVWYANEIAVWGGFDLRRIVTASTDGPTAVASDDLDADGDLDLIVVSFDDDTVAWYENEDGLGTFGAAQPIAADRDGPASLLLADLDGDGQRDLVVASNNDGATVWYANLGSGNFSPAHPITASAARFTAHDLDGDGDADLLGTRTWYRNTDGDGTFSAAIDIASAAMAGRSDAADLDGNGSIDIALTLSLTDEQFAWSANDGDGNFGAAVSLLDLPFGAETWQIAAIDLDGDGDEDILAAQQDPQILYWFENTGGGAFATAESVGSPLSGRIGSVAVADLDRDGDRDLIFSAGGGIFWMENLDGSGQFAALARLTTNAGLFELADVDGDTDLDLVIGSGNSIGWSRNTDGRAQFDPMVTITTAVSALTDISVADIDGNGAPDVMSASNNDHKLAWYRNDGTGGFAGQVVLSTSQREASSIVAGDLDGDGDLDITGANRQYFNSYVRWYRNTDGNGTFSGAVQSFSGSGAQHTVVDLDGDGDQDIVGPSYWMMNTDGAGQFTAPIAIEGLYALARGAPIDLDNDGDLDLAGTAYSPGMYSVENTGGGTMAPSRLLIDRVGGATAVGDIDGDGRPEVIVCPDGTGITELSLWF
jgi:hypothetical protein